MVLENLDSILTGLSFANPINLVLGIILSTIIGGIVLLVLARVIGSKLGDNIGITKPFIVVLIINLITYLGLMAIILPFLSMVPFSGILVSILPLLLWIFLVNYFFEIEFTHAALYGILGYIISFLLPTLTGFAIVFVPL